MLAGRKTGLLIEGRSPNKQTAGTIH